MEEPTRQDDRPSDAEMRKRYLDLYSASLYDVLDQRGYPNQCIDLAIAPISSEMTVAGPAYTVSGTREPRPEEEYEPTHMANFAMLDAIPSGHVIVIDGEPAGPIGNWGELLSTAAQTKGAVGVVIDGGTRDVPLLRKMENWPVFVRYTSPIESNGRWQPKDFGCPIGLGGTLSHQVRVNPGDWIFGDEDGVLVIPRDIAYEVLIEAEEIRDTENLVRQELRDGVSFQSVYDKYERF